ncbi:hypothetical protein HPC38_00755 [Pasteurellaceae bacterium HPA106]|uniref:hypothetical protein n=1 Tax=Spirabiliibacterium pneumoniae TaxID=221400 RepID=UPI001AAD925A|nr:hypothetical protein [Spirabiliibacterium pneumoniae]MBE2895412.1 hypothetical protein [Spirabiliibacterium pneumoniae]
MNDKSRFSARLIKALTDKGYDATPAVLEREFNLRNHGETVTPQAVRKWLCGKSIPRLANLRLLSAWLEVDMLEFVSLEKLKKLELGEMRRNRHLYVWENALSAKEKELFACFMELPDAQKNTVSDVILALHKTHVIPSKT